MVLSDGMVHFWKIENNFNKSTKTILLIYLFIINTFASTYSTPDIHEIYFGNGFKVLTLQVYCDSFRTQCLPTDK